ncbi:hypothetical protein G7Y89_g4588 [Cudoniella acicularis]|uniref:BHLH domain-containing protein n=1 Tax=Cudoniella acicularis TaxID=354080 RepID=A0A8H4RR61_9HELO|nr:hypothetical protein G7Y89_g4588 [Cudoniella acicularis]
MGLSPDENHLIRIFSNLHVSLVTLEKHVVLRVLSFHSQHAGSSSLSLSVAVQCNVPLPELFVVCESPTVFSSGALQYSPWIFLSGNTLYLPEHNPEPPHGLTRPAVPRLRMEPAVERAYQWLEYHAEGRNPVMAFDKCETQPIQPDTNSSCSSKLPQTIGDLEVVPTALIAAGRWHTKGQNLHPFTFIVVIQQQTKFVSQNKTRFAKISYQLKTTWYYLIWTLIQVAHERKAFDFLYSCVMSEKDILARAAKPTNFTNSSLQDDTGSTKSPGYTSPTASCSSSSQWQTSNFQTSQNTSTTPYITSTHGGFTSATLATSGNTEPYQYFDGTLSPGFESVHPGTSQTYQHNTLHASYNVNPSQWEIGWSPDTTSQLGTYQRSLQQVIGGAGGDLPQNTWPREGFSLPGSTNPTEASRLSYNYQPYYASPQYDISMNPLNAPSSMSPISRADTSSAYQAASPASLSKPATSTPSSKPQRPRPSSSRSHSSKTSSTSTKTRAKDKRKPSASPPSSLRRTPSPQASSLASASRAPTRPLQSQKQTHNEIEKQYRLRLNAHFASLLAKIPPKYLPNTPDNIPTSKAETLVLAEHYIKVLEKEEKDLTASNRQLIADLEALKREWERAGGWGMGMP